MFAVFAGNKMRPVDLVRNRKILFHKAVNGAVFNIVFIVFGFFFGAVQSHFNACINQKCRKDV